MKKSVILALTLMLALGVSQAYGDNSPIKPVEIVNQPVDVNVVNESPIAVDANVSFPATLDVNIVNTDPISTTPEVPVNNIVNLYLKIPGAGSPEMYTVPAGKTFVVTDVINGGQDITEGLYIVRYIPGYVDERAFLMPGAYSFRSGLVFNEGETVGVWRGEANETHYVTITGFLQ